MKQKNYVTNKRFGIDTTPSINAYLNSLPKSAVYRQKASTSKTEEVDAGSRTEVSIITTSALDADFEVVNPKGIQTTRFLENPCVLWCHDYHAAPVGTCQWIKAIDEGLKAKSFYPNKPKNFTSDWFIDTVYGLIQTDIMKGKSIGFVEISSHVPTDAEIEARPDLEQCKKIIDSCELLEYSVVAVPSCPDALTIEKISKQFPIDHLERLGIKAPKPNVVKEVVKDRLKKSGLSIEDLTRIALKRLNNYR